MYNSVPPKIISHTTNDIAYYTLQNKMLLGHVKLFTAYPKYIFFERG